MSLANDPQATRRPTIDIGGLLTWAWGLFRANLGYLLGGTAILGAVGVVCVVLGYAVFIARLGLAGAFRTTTDGTAAFTGWEFAGAYGLMFLVLLVLGVLTAWIGVNFSHGVLLLVDGGHPRISSLLRPRRVLPAAGLGLLLMLGFAVGYVLLFIGALAWSFGVQFANLAVADGAGPVTAIRRSIRLVRANLASTALLWLVVSALLFGGYLACGVGLLVAAPVGHLMTAGAYRWLSGLDQEGPATVARG